MRKSISIPFVLGAALVALAPMSTATPQGTRYEIPWATIEGGGISFAYGGDVRLGATSGQADAGVLRGGIFELRVGFWTEDRPGSTLFQDGFESGDFAAWSRIVGAS